MVESFLLGEKMSAIRVWVVVLLVLAPAGMRAGSDQACRKVCGDTTVRYPFGLEPGCGDRKFEGLLSCTGDARLVLNTESGSYDVSIDYNRHTISINDTSLLDCSTLEGPRAGKFTPPDASILSMSSTFIVFSPDNWTLPFTKLCSTFGDAKFGSHDCDGGIQENWNATIYQNAPDPGLLVSRSSLCFNPTHPNYFCVTDKPPDGSSTLPYSSILQYPSPDRSLTIVCSPTIEFSYNVSTPEDNTPSSSPSSANKLGPVLGGVAAGGAGVAASILCFLLGRRRLKSWKSRRSHGKQMQNIATIMDAGSGSSSDPTRFSYKELATATKNFAAERRIGGGGFSVVYRGKLKDGRQVAVKKLHQANLQGRQQFMAELTVLSQAKHPNLVRLYGCCPEQRILVYEYVGNGTLAEHLHGPRSVPSLNCRTRLSIAVEVAEALAHLHSLHPPIVHRDVKSSNILLDEGCRAKVGDFGLSRLHDVDRTHVSTAPQGTPGYLDPDYHQSYHLSDKSDVYSLGVVLMELVSGKKAVDMSRERGEVNLSAMAAARIQSGAMEELLEPGLTNTEGAKNAAMALAELGFQCLATEKDDRPSMQEVVSKIKSIQYMAFAFPSPTLSPLGTHESSGLIQSKSEDWVPSESYLGLDVQLQGR